jgi:c-di-AMP phosphodiesterase-like protein
MTKNIIEFGVSTKTTSTMQLVFMASGAADLSEEAGGDPMIVRPVGSPVRQSDGKKAETLSRCVQTRPISVALLSDIDR